MSFFYIKNLTVEFDLRICFVFFLIDLMCPIFIRKCIKLKKRALSLERKEWLLIRKLFLSKNSSYGSFNFFLCFYWLLFLTFLYYIIPFLSSFPSFFALDFLLFSFISFSIECAGWYEIWLAVYYSSLLGFDFV